MRVAHTVGKKRQFALFGLAVESCTHSYNPHSWIPVGFVFAQIPVLSSVALLSFSFAIIFFPTLIAFMCSAYGSQTPTVSLYRYTWYQVCFFRWLRILDKTLPSQLGWGKVNTDTGSTYPSIRSPLLSFPPFDPLYFLGCGVRTPLPHTKTNYALRILARAFLSKLKNALAAKWLPPAEKKYTNILIFLKSEARKTTTTPKEKKKEKKSIIASTPRKES